MSTIHHSPFTIHEFSDLLRTFSIMEIKQWEDKNLSHFSYGILEEKQIILIDPSRNPLPYLEWVKNHEASIIGIIETHPHADFTSSHLELHETTGAPIYAHSCAGASYPHETMDEGSSIEFGNIRLSALHTPGHSPDSICILLEYDGKQKAVFTGDTLFIGDCGRPDLREGAGNIQAKKEDLAGQMYHSLREKLMKLNDDVVVYPAHGAGTLCGKNLSKESSSTMGMEKQNNWSLQNMTEEAFIKNLLMDQPFVPAYFSFDVELNRKGAPSFALSLKEIKTINTADNGNSELPDTALWIIDGREEALYKKGHLPHSVNLMESGKFETWLGSIIQPGEAFYLAGESEDQLNKLKQRVAAIGYESQVQAGLVVTEGSEHQEAIDLEAFRQNPKAYTIVDVRNENEVKQGKPFKHSIAIPLSELRARIGEIPADKPIVVHCAAGYRSAAASSIIDSLIKTDTKVYDLGDAIKQFL
ncbi:MAG: MBL fold metallo-hydrolase [Flavisolibacter sp.]